MGREPPADGHAPRCSSLEDGEPGVDRPRDPADHETGLPSRFQSLFLIGRGGMGTVEAALDLGGGSDGDGAPGRVVALKRLLPEAARDPRRKEMFLREARLAALLSHPNVVRAYAFGELRGQLYMAMEYVEGESLSEVLRVARERGERVAPALVAAMLAQVCDGLHAAHELTDDADRGALLHVVHRDVSPHNVMVGYGGQIKLVDFGVAKLENAGNETRTGEVKGKMAYMSPEQALGEKLDRRSDLFSVGAVLFECLTGARMWGPGTDLEVMRRLALDRPPLLGKAMPGAPRALADLHARLVAHDPRDRPADARLVADALRAFAAANGGVGNDGLRELMERLFGTRARSRRALLVEALRKAEARPEPHVQAPGLAAPPRAQPHPAPRAGGSWRGFPAIALALLALAGVTASSPPQAAAISEDRSARARSGPGFGVPAPMPVHATQPPQWPAAPTSRATSAATRAAASSTAPTPAPPAAPTSPPVSEAATANLSALAAGRPGSPRQTAAQAPVPVAAREPSAGAGATAPASPSGPGGPGAAGGAVPPSRARHASTDVSSPALPAEAPPATSSPQAPSANLPDVDPTPF